MAKLAMMQRQGTFSLKKTMSLAEMAKKVTEKLQQANEPDQPEVKQDIDEIAKKDEVQT
jgi:hypothetical protein